MDKGVLENYTHETFLAKMQSEGKTANPQTQQGHRILASPPLSP